MMHVIGIVFRKMGISLLLSRALASYVHDRAASRGSIALSLANYTVCVPS